MPCEKVLIVEDDSGIRETLQLVLEVEGYETSLAEDGSQALKALEREAPPCLILLDLMMPVMNGWQFLDAIRKDPRKASIPVVIVTAFALASPPPPAAAVLRKPIDVDHLLSQVKRCCH